MAVIRLLREQDNRRPFDCGHPDLNGFLHDLDYETDIASGLWRVWVVVPQQDDTRILSYYAASPDPVQIVEEGARTAGFIFTAIDLRCLATDRQHQCQGYGRRLLMHAITHAVQAADRCARESAEMPQETHFDDFVVETGDVCAVDYLFAQAVDEKARDWYLRQKVGFRPLSPGSLNLAITIEEMRDIVSRGA